MWSNFAQKQQVKPAPPLPPPPPPPTPKPPQPSQRQSEQPSPSPATTEPRENSHGDHCNGGGDAWSDDDILEDELLDDLLDDVAVDGDDGGGCSDDAAPLDGSDDAPTAGSGSVSSGGFRGGLGGVDSWGSTLQSFASRRHQPLDLSSPLADPPATAAARVAASAASTVPTVAETEDAGPEGDRTTDGWEDDDLFNDSTFETPKREAQPVLASNPNTTPAAPSPLERAAQHFGAALLASINNDDDDGDDYEEDEDEHEEEGKEEKEESPPKKGVGGFGGGFVMKGLSRFIEAATAPQGDSEEDGWGEDDLDFHDDEDARGTGEKIDAVGKDVAVGIDDDLIEKVNEGAPLAIKDADDVADATDANNINVAGMVDVKEEANNDSPPTIKNEAGVDSSPIMAEEVVGDQETKLQVDEPKQQEEETTVGGEGGWGDDDDIDAADQNETKSEKVEPDLQVEPLANEEEEGWGDDIDISFDSPLKTPQQHTHNNVTPKKEIIDSGKSSGTTGVSDSIKDFVAMTESNLDEEFNSVGLWKTPAPKNKKDGSLNDVGPSNEADEMESAASSEVGNFSGMGQELSEVEASIADATFNGDGTTQQREADTKEGVFSKSLAEFVDHLDAELNSTVGGDIDFDRQRPQTFKKETGAAEPTATSEIATMADGARGYSYDNNKDDSPEPVVHQPTNVGGVGGTPPPPASLPHQESWYLNAMEGGKGGVVYGEEKAYTAATSICPKGLIPEVDVVDMSIIPCPSLSVGMPLSEIPSSANSTPSEVEEKIPDNLTKTANAGNDATIKLSELQCKCLEFIMPLPNSSENGFLPDQPGFGKKTLPDGTTVLVNYEKLLQNEATKRILLQRTVDMYEHTIQNLQTKASVTSHYQAVAHHEAEAEGDSLLNTLNIQLQSAQQEIISLKELVHRLEEEKENFANETQLFEAELAATVNDKEYLENEVATLQEENAVALQKSMERSVLEDSENAAEKMRLIDQVEMLQREMEEAREEKDSLGRERDALEERVRKLVGSDGAVETSIAPAVETETALRSTIESLQQELLEKEDEIQQLTGQLGDTEIEELRSTIASLRQELLDKDGELEQFSDRLQETMLANEDRAKDRASELDRLRREIEILQQELIEKDDAIEQLAGELQETAGGERAADEAAETVALRGAVESLQQKLLERGGEIELLTTQLRDISGLADESSKRASAEHDRLRTECNSLRSEKDRLQNDLSGTKSSLARLREENEALRVMRRENEVEIAELRAAAELMECGSGEVDRLAAEVASLTYDLGVKSAECRESVSALKSLRSKLDGAEARLTEYDGVPKGDDVHDFNKTFERSLRAENEALVEQVKGLQGDCALLEAQKSALEVSLEEQASRARSLEMQIQSLNAHVFSSTVLQGQLANARKMLDDKAEECAESAAALQSLEAKFDLAEARLVEYESKSNKSSEIEQSLRAEASLLNKQLKDFGGKYNSLKDQKSDLENKLEERASVIQRLETQIQVLNGMLADYSDLRGELSRVTRSLDDKANECQAIMSSREQLKLDLLNAQSDCEAVILKGAEAADEARAQISMLQSQNADLLKDDAMMKKAEEQLAKALQENSTLHSRCEEYRAKFEDATEERAECTENITKLRGENSELYATLQRLQFDLESKEWEASGGASKIKQLQRSVDDMRHENNCLINKNAEIAQSLEARTSDAQEKINLLEQECTELCSKIDRSQKASADAEQTVRDLKQQLQALNDTMQEKSDFAQSMKVKASTAEQQSNLMKLECAKLRSNLDSSQTASAEARQIVTNLKAQANVLKDANAKLEDKLFEASFEAPEAERLAEENARLRKERDELKEESHGLSQRINELAAQADDFIAKDKGSPEAAFTPAEREALIDRINTLEEELKAEKLNELRDELTSLHEERQQLDLDNEELLVQLGLIQQEKMENQTECEVEVTMLREQVSNLQDQCKRLQDDLDGIRSNSLEPGDKDHAKILQGENTFLHQTISQLSMENDSLNDQIGDLAQKIEGLELENSQIIKNLRQKLGLLELKLADKEEEVESARKEMQIALDAKDGEISKLKTEHSSRENELKEMSSKLDNANNEMGFFNSQLERLQSQHLQDRYDAAHRLTEEEKAFEEDDEISLQDLLAEAVLDSDDSLRSQIIVLAQALERSELQRADALERIFDERKSNEESLRQLGESVKRFYTMVRRTNAA